MRIEPRMERGYRAMLSATGVLVGSQLRPALRRSTLISGVSAPAMFLIAFFILFRSLLAIKGVNYSQFLPPAIVVQAMLLTALTTAFFVTRERRSGILARWRIMPIHRSAVLMARMVTDAVRAMISIVILTIIAYILGFRFHSLPGAVGFVVLAVGLALSFGAGTAAIGLAAKSPEVIASLLFIPYLPLLVLSTGYVPADQFPAWARTAVSASPVSCVMDGMRAMADGQLTSINILWAFAWEVSLGAIFVMVAIRAFRRMH